MLTTIRLYGRLAKFLKRRVFRADVATPAEAVRALLVNFPQLEDHMVTQHYRVSLGERDIDRDELHHPAGQQEISIVPVVAGAGGVGKVIAGIALVVASIFLAPIVAPLLGAALAGGLATIVGGIGASLAIGGVSQMLAPTPTMGAYGTDQWASNGRNNDTDPQRSYSFSGVQNVSRQGVSVPIVFGEALVGSVVVSVGIDVDQVTA